MPQKSKSKKKFNVLKRKKEKVLDKTDPRIERIYEEWIELKDPVTGKLVKHKVKIVRYKTITEPQEIHVIRSSDANQELDNIDDGLHIYSVDEKDVKENE